MSNLSRPNILLSREELLLRLDEADETLRAIRSGEVDALVVSGTQGDQIFTLKDAALPYQVLIEEMNEGALTLSLDGLILYCNSRFAEIIGFPMGLILGETFFHFVISSDQVNARGLLEQSLKGNSRGEVTLLGNIPVGISLKKIKLGGELRLGAVLTDLSERKRAENEIRALNATLEQRVTERTQQLDIERARWQGIVEGIADEVWTCDSQGKMSLLNLGTITAAELGAFKEKSADILYEDVDILYPDGQPRPLEQSPLLRSLRGEIVRGEEILRHRQTGVLHYRHFSSAPTRDAVGAVTGAVEIVRDITEQKRAEEGLHRYELLSTNSKDIVLFVRIDDGRILEANSAALRAYGYNRSELLALTLRKLRSRGTHELTDDQMAQAEAEGILYETLHQRKGGISFPVEVSSQGATIGGVRTLICIVRDISERRLAETKQAYLASFPEQNPNPIVEVDFDGQVQYANSAAQHRYPDLRTQGPAHAWLADWDSVTRPLREGRTAVRTREVVVGSRVYQQTLQYLPKERLIRIYGTDITVRRRAEEQMERSNRKLNEILASIQDDFYVLDRDWNFVYANALVTAKMGKKNEDFVGKNIWKMFPKHVGTVFEENIRLAMEKREIRRFEIGGIHTNAWYRMTVFPSADGITVIGTDITDRKQAEEALRESESRFRTFIESAPVAISLGRNGKLIYVNPMYIKMYGFDSAKELIGHSTADLVATQSRGKSIERSQRRAQGLPTEKQYELTGVRKDGTEFPMFASVTMLSLTDGPANIGFFQDITEHKLAEKALEESEERFRAVVENALDAIVVSDPSGDGKVLSANSSACRMFGYDMEEFLGLDRNAMLDTHDPNFAAFMEQRERQGQVTTELTYKRKDGARFSGELSSAYYQDKNGERRAIAIIRDITERKQVAEQLSSALQEKEVLLKEIHHRVKNNLQVISSLLRLQAATLDDPHIRELFSESQRRVRAMALIHEQLYQSSNLARVDFRDYLHNLVNYLRRSYTQSNSNVQIRVTVENVVIEMDQAMPLGLMVSELVSNSLKYAFPSMDRADHAQTGEIWIDARRDHEGVLILIVGDNGIGLPENLDIDHSPTMGLQLVRSFVTQLQGQFTLQRKPGTIFTITIPERIA